MNRLTILIGEDNAADMLLVKKCLKEILNLEVRLIEAKDGREVLEKIEQNSCDEESSNIGLILLDLNMPKLSGHQVLKEVKRNEKYKLIPVIILSSSDAEEDIEKAYKNHANCYIQKPRNLEGYRSICRKINEFWFSTASLPICPI